jgi:hypothetical protein
MQGSHPRLVRPVFALQFLTYTSRYVHKLTFLHHAMKHCAYLVCRRTAISSAAAHYSLDSIILMFTAPWVHISVEFSDSRTTQDAACYRSSKTTLDDLVSTVLNLAPACGEIHSRYLDSHCFLSHTFSFSQIPESSLTPITRPLKPPQRNLQSYL